MKAKDYPEKIYLHPDLDSIFGMTERSCKSEIEYTRTDAFIEKACELLNRMIWEVTYEDLEGNSTQHYDKTEFIEEFEEYLKK